MATANFPSVNTSKIYAFGFDIYYDAETIEANDYPAEWLGKYDEDSTRWNYEMIRDSAVEMLERKGWGDGNRKAIAGKKTTLTIAGVDIELSLDAYVHNGYYEGAVFDVEPSIEVWDRNGNYLGGDDWEYVDADCIIEENWCANVGLSKIHAHNIDCKIHAEMQAMIDEAEAVFQECSEYRLGIFARFCNGEVFYTDLEKQSA